MVEFDATEVLTPFREGRGDGAILVDGQRLRQADPRWMTPEFWADRATAVSSGGRGGAWFLDAPFGASILRQYRRGGLAASVSRDRYLWQGASRTRSFAEFRITRKLYRLGLPVPAALMASYVKQGGRYRAAILLERLPGVQTLAERIHAQGSAAPFEDTGRLIARFHRAGLDHADLNVHNLLFDAQGKGWMIDFDRARMHIPATRWRERNLARLRRSLLKIRGTRSKEAVLEDYGKLRRAYDAAWSRGF
jgi:3-deoxy-D-manno-octulosonic acid kinase